jgi:hypothetical protein
MKLVSYGGITLAGATSRDVSAKKIVSALRPRHFLAETPLDVAPASDIPS